MSSQVLVLGAAGRLGSVLCPFLRSANINVISHSRKGDTDVFSNLVDEIETFTLLETVMPDTIVNLAAMTNVDDCEVHPVDSWSCNVQAIMNVVSWIKLSTKSCHLIQISSDGVYGGPGPHSEENIQLINVYAQHKYEAEIIAQGVNASILRTNFFGKIEPPARPSLTDWIFEEITHRRGITVFQDVSFSPLSIRSLSAEILSIIRQPLYGTFNIGSRNGMSKADFAGEFARILELPTGGIIKGKLKDVATITAPRPLDTRMDCSSYERVTLRVMPTLIQELEREAILYGIR